MRWCVLSVVLALAGLALPARAAEPTGAKGGHQYALLVGCTRYPNLLTSQQLAGPANDVLLIRRLLVDRFHFAEKDVVILSEAAAQERGDKWCPTRANIEREFGELARKARAGDRVVIFLAGHGSREPDTRPNDPNRFKPDGMEEIFLPRDVGDLPAWDRTKGRVPNAIADYELRDWLKKIRDHKASLWVIVDACHSATMVRGSEHEVVREVQPRDLVPPDVLQAVQQRLEGKPPKKGPGGPAGAPFKLLPEEPDLVALYAAQVSEPTVELEMPPDADQGTPYGLLAYTLSHVLTEAKTPLTYTDLVQRIHDQYVAWGRQFPTPLVEGKDRDHFVLDDRERASATIRLQRDGNAWKVNAGRLHGLTPGSILAVKPPAGQGDEPQGYVEVTRDGLDTLEARVKPCPYDKLPARNNLPDRGRCELVFIDYGDLRLKVGVDGKTGRDEPVPDDLRQRLQGVLEDLAREKDALVKPVSSPREAQWLLRLESLAARNVHLLPASGVALAHDAKKAETRDVKLLPPRFGSAPLDDKLKGWLQERLRRIASAQNLLSIGVRSQDKGASFGEGMKVRVEALRLRGADDREGEPLSDPNGMPVVHDQDVVGFEITNDGLAPADVTLLYVDSEYDIHAIFPQVGKVMLDNRLSPQKKLRVGRSKINADTVGLEQVVLIAVKGSSIDQYANFSFLAREDAEKAKEDLKSTKRGLTDFKSPLGELLRNARYAEGGRRGIGSAEEDAPFAMQVLSWTVSPERRPADKGQ